MESKTHRTTLMQLQIRLPVRMIISAAIMLVLISL